MITICKKCKHSLNLEPDSPRASVWYNWLCQRYPATKRTDPVTGEERYCDPQGGFTDKPYAYCSNINTGACAQYERA